MAPQVWGYDSKTRRQIWCGEAPASGAVGKPMEQEDGHAVGVAHLDIREPEPVRQHDGPLQR